MYQFPRTACYGSTQVLRGLTELNVRLFHGPRPYTLIVFFVKSTAANGSYQLNPQRTDHLNTINCCAYFNSYQYPQPSYRPDFEQVDVAPLYNALLKVWNVNKTYNCGFPLSAFNESQTYFAFPMDPNGSIETAALVPPVGDVSIKFRFSKETDQTYNMYWYVISHATVAIDASRVVTMNYKAEIPHFGLRANSTICFAGPAGSGKTTLIAALIKQRASTIPDLGPIKKMVFCIGAQQKVYNDIQSSVLPYAKCETS
uniref:ABC transporter domain-containing protein n=1 Tax=Plectus sambesii TaxID=2011161 RepID=A0A914X259_9BILA